MENLEKIKSIVASIARQPVESISADTRIYDTLKLDSLDFVELILELESKFNINIYEYEEKGLKKVKTVAGVLDYINKKVGGKH